MEKECVGWGWWQARIATLLALPVLLTGMYCTNYVFLAARTPHRSVHLFSYFLLLYILSMVVHKITIVMLKNNC